VATANNDSVAREIRGSAYDAIPKSVFGVVVWYLADCASDGGVDNDGELQRFAEELEAMHSNGILGERQVKRAQRALAGLDPQQGETK
jgi:hypothetical protein